ncbi:hypothetical protein GSI_09045 [Ganoderma sinense ZZ0214-1]|uniref:Uncharacterized protein n=1 Tax=Ganoderma sinense ZZ0214-1 TaxID=1077348 RepID=A0A2G8S633_9APHY|nr:hypothetical protein GSI_09045 [Ganoderma sinense ZZ0214-1]
MSIARSVCQGKVLTDSMYRFIPRMPQLSEHARELYTGAHGTQRYEGHNDTDGMPHGARPPDLFGRIKTVPELCHRPEHDVESIYWSMVSALLHVRPADENGEPEIRTDFAEAWQALLTHRIPKGNGGYGDPRLLLLFREEADWLKLFIGNMKLLGPLLHDISQHIRPEYALCGEGLLPDHLHEAIQRLILQYLVDHDDVPLHPDYLRPVPQPQRRAVKPSSSLITTQSSAVVTIIKTTVMGSTQAAENPGTGSALGGKCADSLTSKARVAIAPKEMVVNRKRNRSSPAGQRSKRSRKSSGFPQSIEEYCA